MKQTYLPKEVADALQVTERCVLKVIPTIKEIKVIRFGRFIRIDKDSFDIWFNGEEYESGINETYTPKEISEILRMSQRCIYNLLRDTDAFRVLRFGKTVRIHKQSFDGWFS